MVHLSLSFATLHLGDDEIILPELFFSLSALMDRKFGECMGEISVLFTLLHPFIRLIPTKMEKQYLVRIVHI